MPFQGIPQQPIVIFRSGEILIIVRSTKIGIVRRLVMIPTEQAMWTRNIMEDELDYSISEFGGVIREYPDAYFEEWSTNPENPVTVCYANYDGSYTIDNDIQSLKDIIANKDTEIQTSRSANRNLLEKIKELSAQLRELRGGGSGS